MRLGFRGLWTKAAQSAGTLASYSWATPQSTIAWDNTFRPHSRRHSTWISWCRIGSRCTLKLIDQSTLGTCWAIGLVDGTVWPLKKRCHRHLVTKNRLTHNFLQGVILHSLLKSLTGLKHGFVASLPQFQPRRSAPSILCHPIWHKE